MLLDQRSGAFIVDVVRYNFGAEGDERCSQLKAKSTASARYCDKYMSTYMIDSERDLLADDDLSRVTHADYLVVVCSKDRRPSQRALSFGTSG